MRIVISGSSGFIGSALAAKFCEEGHAVTRLVREGTSTADNSIYWNPAAGKIDAAALEGHDVALCLNGANLVSRRWTVKRKELILRSRVDSTALLSKTLASLSRPPRVFLSASAIGYYGNRDPAEEVDEDAAPGSGFLASLCQQWEAAAAPAEEAGIRVVNMRTGVVLSLDNAPIAQMVRVFSLGLGGKLGGGRQILSWIALADLIAAVWHAIGNGAISGPVNLSAPGAVSNAEFSSILGRVLGRPALATLPAFAARAMFGEMADEAMLSGARVVPRKLRESGFRFAWAELEGALEEMLRGAKA